MNELALFAGAGGGILGGKLLGWRTVCAVELNAFCRRVLLARQNDGSLPAFPIWDDVRTFDGVPWRGAVDVVSGGFPCQDISSAGPGHGIDGARSGLWREFARIIREVGPRYVFVENSPRLTGKGLHRVLADLAEMGFDARWGVLGAVHAGAPHIRERIWIVAHARSVQLRQQPGRRSGPDGQGAALAGVHGQEEPLAHANGLGRGEVSERLVASRGANGSAQDVPQGAETGMGDTNGAGLEKRLRERGDPRQECAATERAGWWDTEPDVGRVAHGMAHRVDRLKCIGNGQVPAVVRLAWQTLTA